MITKLQGRDRQRESLRDSGTEREREREGEREREREREINYFLNNLYWVSLELSSFLEGRDS